MKAIITALKFNVNGVSQKTNKPYKYTELTIRPIDGGKGKTSKIFPGTPLANACQTVTVGDYVEYQVDETSYANLILFTKIAAPAKDEVVASTTPGAGKAPYVPYDDSKKSADIARAVALKAAVDIVGHMLDNELFKKTSKPELIISETFAIAKAYEDYLTGNAAKAIVTGAVGSVAGAHGDDESIPF
jgi:hypothetical protein